ncbi:acyl-CoA synthetase [Nocardia sp. NPDC020380]|uniref:acyl-CoA synthetase n=1 Tax=Nocardia sp. NPDC020380 TaxID=3364309 RepID=UPI003793E97F
MTAHIPLLTALSAPDRIDHPAVVTIGADSISRADLYDAAMAFAERVTGAGRVAIITNATVETVIAMAGCLLAGVTVVPVPPDAGHAEREHILTDSAARYWVGTAPDEHPMPVIPVDRRARTSSPAPAEPPESATALIMYTSGTTGAPKGVLLSRKAIAACIDALAEAWEWNAGDTLVHGLPLFHVHGLVLGVLGALRLGSPLIHTVRPKPESYAAAAGSLYFGVPTVWSRVCEQPEAARALRSARLLVSGSAPLPVPVFDRLTALTGIRPIERYGMSETLITVSTRFRGERRPGWVGLPLSGVRTRVRDENGDDVPRDGVSLGQLQINGPTLFDGYLGLPEKTAESMTADGWFRTGDIVAVESTGFHRIAGRESVDMIKSGGYRIGAGEIEHALLSHPGVAEAAVVGIADPDLGQRIVAYVVGDIDDPEQLSAFVTDHLAFHKRPRQIHFVDALPRNAMGKVQKKLLTG